MTNTGQSSTPACGQCGKPAIVFLDEQPVCVDCHYKFQQSQWMQFAQHAAMINMLDQEMAASVGMLHLANPIAIPAAPVPPIYYNNQAVTVQGGTVGAINFGNVHEIQVSLQAVTQNGEVGIADALAQLTNAVLSNNDASEAVKNDLLEQLAFLSSQAAAPVAERKPGMIKSVFTAVKDGAAAIGGLAEAWGAVEPLLNGHFGL